MRALSVLDVSRTPRHRAGIRHAVLVLLGCGLLAIAAPARAVESAGEVRALPCRPTIACTADLVPTGAFEIEAGLLGRKLGGGVRQGSTPLLLKLTVARWLQMQLGTNSFVWANDAVGTRYLDDVVVGPKVHLVDQAGAVPSLSVSLLASIPTFAQRGYVRTYDAALAGYVTKDVGPLHVDLNFGLDVLRLEESSRAQPFEALAFSLELSRHFGVMLEEYVFGAAAPIAPRDAGLLAALSISPRRSVVFDVGGDLGLFPATRALSLFVGVTFVPFTFGADREEPEKRSIAARTAALRLTRPGSPR